MLRSQINTHPPEVGQAETISAIDKATNIVKIATQIQPQLITAGPPVANP